MSVAQDDYPEEAQDNRELSGTLLAQLERSMEALSRAQALAWFDLPMNERRRYLQHVVAAMNIEQPERVS